MRNDWQTGWFHPEPAMAVRCGIGYAPGRLLWSVQHGMRGLAKGRQRGHRGSFLAWPAIMARLTSIFPQIRRELQVSTDDPMMASMAGRYASALFELAKQDKQLPEVEGQLKAFQTMLDDSAELRRLVRSPVISAGDQAKALSAILQRAGISGITANFLNLITRKRRLFAVGDMIKGFRVLLARERGEVSADVATAHALTPDQLTQLKDALRISVGKDVQVNTRVDPNLLGGLVVKIGSRMIDSSLRTKLNNLKVAMKGIG